MTTTTKMMTLLVFLPLLLVLFESGPVHGWTASPSSTAGTKPVQSTHDLHDNEPVLDRTFGVDGITMSSSSRRQWMIQAMKVGVVGVGGGVLALVGDAQPSVASVESATTTSAATQPMIQMKEFVDPQGLFSLRVPQSFYTLRRSAKGDLPDSKTGKGRRGSSIFTAGNMAKAEVVAVERFPVRVLLEENGIILDEIDKDSSSKTLSTFPSIGDAKAVANLLVLRRERETQNQSIKTLDNVQLSPDGKELTFRLKTEIEVQKPELLLEQVGVSQLFRITLAKATLNSNDGNLMAVFASALEQDFNNGVDGPALEDVISSFTATDQSSSSSSSTSS